MKLTVGKWGNSLAVRIPRELAEDLRLVEGAELSAVLEAGGLRIAPVRRRRTVTELTKGMKAPKGSAEYPWGAAVGKEVW